MNCVDKLTLRSDCTIDPIADLASRLSDLNPVAASFSGPSAASSSSAIPLDDTIPANTSIESESMKNESTDQGNGNEIAVELIEDDVEGVWIRRSCSARTDSTRWMTQLQIYWIHWQTRFRFAPQQINPLLSSFKR